MEKKREVIHDILYANDKMLLAERLEELIKANGCSMKRLAEKTNMTTQSLNRLLKGRQNVGDVTRIIILSALKLNLFDFYNTPKLMGVLMSLEEAEEKVREYRKEEGSKRNAAEGEKAE